MRRKGPAKPRELPPMAGFGVPYAELAHASRHFLSETRQAWAVAEASKVQHEIGDKLVLVPDVSALFAAQRSSKATQVFAAMAVEAAINTFGVVHFGHDVFEQHFGGGALADRMIRVVKDVLGKTITPGDPALVALRSLGVKRNALVHVRPIETIPDDRGVLRTLEPKARPRASLDAAEEAVNEMHQIVKWLRELDYAAYHFLGNGPFRARRFSDKS